ncbi:hypothetical protein [Methanoculleus frigidifontis]|uniref:hypothetical protein n=1 Tax=Methanoculleus frigidifontis TaxID=2584085 RepID=UPI00265B49FD|nr:hypothetical protein [Methanoculleus sp. FWC-SCC1]
MKLEGSPAGLVNSLGLTSLWVREVLENSSKRFALSFSKSGQGMTSPSHGEDPEFESQRAHRNINPDLGNQPDFLNAAVPNPGI